MSETDKRSFYAYWFSEGEEWVGTCPDFPSLSWMHESPAEALNGIKKLVTDYGNYEPMTFNEAVLILQGIFGDTLYTDSTNTEFHPWAEQALLTMMGLKQ